MESDSSGDEEGLLVQKSCSENYRTFLLLNLTTSPLSTLQRAYIPALIQSQLYNQNVASPEAFILKLRSWGSLLSVVTMPLLLYIKPVILLRFIIILFAMFSMIFILPIIIPNGSKWITSGAYIGMISFTALYESCLSSIIPGLIRQGEDSKEVSGRSMIFSDFGALSVLIAGYIFALAEISLNYCVFGIGLIVFSISFQLKKLGQGENRMLQWRSNVIKLCIAWGLWNCGMVNFMMIVNMKFRKLYLGNDPMYTGFMIWSFTCAAFGTFCWMKIGNIGRCWVYGLSLFTMAIYLYVIVGVFDWNPLGLKYGIEFWVIECLYIAISSSFRSLNRALYSEVLPKGEESQFFGLEILVGIVGNWIIGYLGSIIKTRFEKDGFVVIVSLVMSMASLAVYGQCDLN